jgi:hypothetical protein
MSIYVIVAVVLVSVLVLGYLEWASRRNLGWPSDAECIEIMRQEGVDLSKPRTLEFHLLFPSRQVAVDAEPTVIAAGFEAQVFGGGPGAASSGIVARRLLLPTKVELLTVRRQLTPVARKYGGTYQGCYPRA